MAHVGWIPERLQHSRLRRARRTGAGAPAVVAANATTTSRRHFPGLTRCLRPISRSLRAN